MARKCAVFLPRLESAVKTAFNYAIACFQISLRRAVLLRQLRLPSSHFHNVLYNDDNYLCVWNNSPIARTPDSNLSARKVLDFFSSFWSGEHSSSTPFPYFAPEADDLGPGLESPSGVVAAASFLGGIRSLTTSSP